MRHLPLIAMCLAAPAVLAAQVPGSSTRAVGMGGAYGALARGYEAPAWNPALLGIGRQPHFSIGLPQAQVQIGNNSFSIDDIRNYADSNLTDADKQYLLSRVVNDDSTLALDLTAGLHGLGISVGHLAFSISQSAFATGRVPRDAVEFGLYGNWNTPGGNNVIRLTGTGGNAWGATTLAGSYAMSLSMLGKPGAVGVTVKRVWGNFLGMMSNTQSSVSADSINVNASTMYSNYPNQSFTNAFDVFSKAAATGIGVDLGGAIELMNRRLTVSASLVNLFGSMKWKEDRLRYTNTIYTLRTTAAGTVADTSSFLSLDDPVAIAANPAAKSLRDSLMTTTDFARLLRVGSALRSGGLTLAADLSFRLKEGLDYHSNMTLNTGLEYVLLGFLPLRGGYRTDFEDLTAVSAGTGLRLGPVALDISAQALLGSVHPGVVTAVGLGLFF